MKEKKQNYKYIQNYNKENYKEFRCWLDNESYKILIDYINRNYNSKSCFLKDIIIKLIDNKK